MVEIVAAVSTPFSTISVLGEEKGKKSGEADA